MIDVDVMQGYIRDANPIPTLDDLAPDELTAFVAAARTRRAALMQAPTQHPAPATPITPPPQRRRKAWAFAVGFVVILLVVGAAALFLRGDDTRVADEPAPTTTLGQEAEAAINVDSLSWTRISFGSEGPSLAITEGGPGLIGLGVYQEPDPNDLADGGGGPGWVQGYFDITTVWTSPDAYEWSQVPSEDGTIGVFDYDGEVAGIAGRDDLLVAVAGNDVWTSPDGFTWSHVPDGTFRYNVDSLSGVITEGLRFIAFGDNETSGRAAVWSSTDGKTWNRVHDDPTVFGWGSSIEGMTVGGPGLVAWGFDETTSNPVLWTSPDGYTWKRLPHDPAVFGEGISDEFYSGMRINDVAAGGPGLVAVGSDMTNWSHDDPTSQIIAAAWTSPDGVTWNRVPHDPALFEGQSDEPFAAITAVAAVGDGFIAIGEIGGRATVMTSRDGVTWASATDAFEIDSARMDQVIAGGPGVIILGNHSIWIGSPDQPTE